MTSLAWSFILSPGSTKNTGILYLFRQFLSERAKKSFLTTF